MRAILVACWLVASSAVGQITGPSTVKQGERIVMSVKLAEGERAVWVAESGADVVKFNGNQAYAWGTAGRTSVYKAIVIQKDENAADVTWLHSVTVDGTPVPPGPVTTLKQLAGDKAAKLATFYAGLAKQVQNSSKAATFRAAHDSLLAQQGLTGHGATAAIDQKLKVVLVDPLDHAKLRDLLLEFAAQLGDLPPPEPDPIPPTVGKRRVVILHETGDDTTADGALYGLLRNGEPAAYLDSKGHVLDIFDDDPDNQPPAVAEMLAKLNVLGVPPPSLFILDLETGAVLHKQPRPATPAEVLNVVKSHGG